MVIIGSEVLLVPVRAVRQSLDPAGGAQLQAIVEALPFWPSDGELRVAAERFLSELNRCQGTGFHLPPLPAAAAAEVGADAPLAHAGSGHKVEVEEVCSERHRRDGTHSSVRGKVDTAASEVRIQGEEMPPDTFSRPKVRLCCESRRMEKLNQRHWIHPQGSRGSDRDGESTADLDPATVVPLVIKKPVVVVQEGGHRVAVIQPRPGGAPSSGLGTVAPPKGMASGGLSAGGGRGEYDSRDGEGQRPASHRKPDGFVGISGNGLAFKLGERYAERLFSVSVKE